MYAITSRVVRGRGPAPLAFVLLALGTGGLAAQDARPDPELVRAATLVLEELREGHGLPATLRIARVVAAPTWAGEAEDRDFRQWSLALSIESGIELDLREGASRPACETAGAGMQLCRWPRTGDPVEVRPPHIEGDGREVVFEVSWLRIAEEPLRNPWMDRSLVTVRVTRDTEGELREIEVGDRRVLTFSIGG